MNTLCASPSKRPASVKCSREWQEAQWVKWPTAAHWPGTLDIYEAAAFRRVHPDTFRRATTPGRDNKCRLKHQRLGSIIRIEKKDVEKFGVVEGRT